MAAIETMKSTGEIEGALYAALADNRGCAADELEVGGGIGRIDSLEGVELVATAEEVFGITVKDSELTASICTSVPRLARLILSKLA